MSAAEAPEENEEIEDAAGPDPGKSDEALDEQLAGAMVYALPAGTLLLALVAGTVFGAGMVILVLAAGVLIGGIAAFWQSVRTLAGETPLTGADAYAIGAPRAEEEQKRAVLRALKDLEFERGVGKISEDDYGVLVTKYRAEAKRLLRMLDEEAAPRRQQVEALVARRMRRAGLVDEAPKSDAAPASAVSPVAPKTRDDADEAGGAKSRKRRKRSKDEPSPSTSAATRGRTCPSCAAMNDSDAVFCKKCASRLASDADAADDADDDDGPRTDGGAS